MPKVTQLVSNGNRSETTLLTIVQEKFKVGPKAQSIWGTILARVLEEVDLKE